MRGAVLVVGLSTSLLVAACGDTSSATNADSPSAAGVAVRLGCRDTFRAGTDAVPVGPKPVAQGHCSVQGRDVDINVYENALVRVQGNDLGKVFLCGATNGAPDVKVWMVEDANWIASPRDAYGAEGRRRARRLDRGTCSVDHAPVASRATKGARVQIGIFGGDGGGRTIDQIVADAQRAADDGFSSFTMSQIFAYDSMTILALVSQRVPRIGLQTGVVPTYSRHPVTMAQQALTVQAASSGRFTLGIGLSHQLVVENMFGLSFEKPVRHMREYLSVLMPLLHDGSASFNGEVISTELALTVDPRVTPHVVVAALGTQMLNLAGTLADGTATWMTGPATLASHIVPTITAAAEKAGRPAPRITAALPVCVTGDADAARAAAAKDFQVYGFLPSYRAMLDREGAAGPGDVAIVGDEATVEKQVRALADAGVTEFVAAEFGSREERARTRTLLKALL